MDSCSVTQHPEFSQEFLQQLHKEINTIKTKLPRGTSSNTVVLHSEADEAGSNTDNLLFDEIQYECFRMKVKTPYAHQQSINDNAGPMPKPALHMIHIKTEIRQKEAGKLMLNHESVATVSEAAHPYLFASIIHFKHPLKCGEDSFELNADADLAEEFSEVERISKVHILHPKTKNSMVKKEYQDMSKKWTNAYKRFKENTLGHFLNIANDLIKHNDKKYTKRKVYISIENKENETTNVKRLSKASSHNSIKRAKCFRTHSFVPREDLSSKRKEISCELQSSITSTEGVIHTRSGKYLKGVVKNSPIINIAHK